MGKHFAISCVLFLALPAAWPQSDNLGSIRQELITRYPLTVFTADRSSILTSGSLLTLKKSDLLAGDGTVPLVLASTYRAGRITRGLVASMTRNASATRTFVAGEKLWLTDIEVKQKEVVFALTSDQYSGVRYRANLAFPFIKGTLPSPAEILALVAEVFDTENPVTNLSGRPAQPAAQIDADRATIPPPPPNPVVAQISPDPRYGRITADDLDRINDATVRFDLNYIRLNPGALDSKPVMQYFAALNNCNHREIERALANELDYSAVASYYKSNAAAILASLPHIIPDVSFDRFIGGQQSGNWRLWTQSLTLGEYDRSRGVFPLRYPGKDVVDLPESLSTPASNRDLRTTCPAAQNFARAVRTYLPATYEINLRPASYRELHMDEASARAYIDSAGAQRSVFLAVDVSILDTPPAVEQQRNFVGKAAFRAQLARLRVIDSRTQKPLGALFDDGSLASDRPIASTPPAAPPSTPNPTGGNWGFTDHMYDIRMSVYVSLAADACNWPLTDQQKANLRRFLDDVSNRGNFNEKYQYNLARGNVTNSIGKRGRIEFCNSPSERLDFDKYSKMVAPLGPLAAGTK